MMRLRHWQGAAVVLACCGLLMPPSAVQADGTLAKRQTTQIKATDVALSPSGALKGVVYTPNGHRVDGATIAILQGDKIVTHTNTNDKGTFEVQQLKPGMYQVVVGNHGAPVRVWSAQTAPPAAKHEANFVVGTAVRAQDEFVDGGAFFGLDVITLATLGGAVTAGVLAGINQKDLDDLDKKVDKLLSP
ncbi:MAG: carboxypeptidase regulatory-like domain-containing protein [Planctomycetaceae bacterium]|nr:carboxypeptidase regulatory-like domain-containing protein [Planctomycetaceae bacterium]